jgi:hypothetical protein
MDGVLDTALDPTIRGSQVAAAVMALCSMIQMDYSRDQDRFCSFFAHQDRWLRFLEVYLRRAEYVKAKISRSLFTVYLKQLQSFNQWPELRRGILYKLFEPIEEPGERQLVKTALNGICYMLEKYVSLAEFVGLFEQEKSCFDGCRAFLRRILYWSTHHEIVPSAGRTLGLFLQAVQTSELFKDDPVDDLWFEPLVETVRQSPESLFRLKSHVLPPLFGLSLSGYYSFLHRLGLEVHLGDVASDGTEAEDELESSILFTSLQCGKEIGIVLENDDLQSSIASMDEKVIFIQTKSLTRLLLHSSASFRLCGLSILISSPAKTRPFSPETLAILKENLPLLSLESDAGIRQEMLALLSHFVDRLRGSTSILKRASNNQTHGRNSERSKLLVKNLGGFPSQQSRKELRRHEQFTIWLVGYLVAGLRPGSGHQRHVFSLRAFIILVKSGLDPTLIDSKPHTGQTWAISVCCTDARVVRLLQDLTLDPFDDIRSLATNILEIMLRSHTSMQIGFEAFVDIADAKMRQTGRADHADGVSRLYSVLSRLNSDTVLGKHDQSVPQSYLVVEKLTVNLEAAIRSARSNLAAAISAFPLHGILSSLR